MDHPAIESLDELTAKIIREVSRGTSLDAANQAAVDARARVTAERVLMERRATLPLTEELRRVGYDVESVWDLVRSREVEVGPDVVPILFRHLELGNYPDLITVAIARALGRMPADLVWEGLVKRYAALPDGEVKAGIGGVLEMIARKRHLPSLLTLLADEANGRSRLMFIRSVWRFGGEEGHDLVRSLVDDPQLGTEATAVVKGRRPSD